MEKTEDYINKITLFMLQEDVDSAIAPIDYYNHWLHVSGLHITDLHLASKLLEFIKEALVNKEMLIHFI